MTRLIVIIMLISLSCFAGIGDDANRSIKQNGEIQSIKNVDSTGGLCAAWSITFLENNFQVKTNFHKKNCYKIQITNTKRQMTVAEMNRYLEIYGKFNKTEEWNVFISVDKKIRVIYKDNKLTIENTFFTKPELLKTIQKLEAR